ncbi:hypothetical protein ACWDX6_21975 [Streptomyces sp. NPDC003027]
MRLRRLLAPLLLAGTLTACTSVDGTAPRPPDRQSPGLRPAGVPAPQPVVETPSSPTPGPFREELASAEPAPPNNGRSTPRTSPKTPKRTAGPDRRKQAGSEQAEKRKRRPARIPAAPRSTYDMRDLCRQSDGVVHPGVTGLCRDTYGR